MNLKTMQFDVFANPIVAARTAYPYVVALQSDFTRGEGDEIVAPVAPKESLAKFAGRLTPMVRIGSADYVVLVPALTSMKRRDLTKQVSSLATGRSQLLAAIDYLFFGV
jgi:toxin CcdB